MHGYTVQLCSALCRCMCSPVHIDKTRRIARDALSRCLWPAQRKRPAVQGFGNVGAWASEIFQEQGGEGWWQCLTPSAPSTNEKGLDIKALRKHIASGTALKDFPEGVHLSSLVSACRACGKLRIKLTPQSRWHLLMLCLAR